MPIIGKNWMGLYLYIPNKEKLKNNPYLIFTAGFYINPPKEKENEGNIEYR